MKTLRESLFNKKNLDRNNKYNIAQDDMIGHLKGFPVGVVVRMMEEQELQGNKPDVEVFQRKYSESKANGGFDWLDSRDGIEFWESIIPYLYDNKLEKERCFRLFFKKYPEYKKYN